MSHRTSDTLIADGDAIGRNQVRRAAKQTGLACERTETAISGMTPEIYDRRVVDLAIMNDRMPGHDGLCGMRGRGDA
jgi:hypothetical protein